MTVNQRDLLAMMLTYEHLHGNHYNSTYEEIEEWDKHFTRCRNEVEEYDVEYNRDDINDALAE